MNWLNNVSLAFIGAMTITILEILYPEWGLVARYSFQVFCFTVIIISLIGIYKN